MRELNQTRKTEVLIDGVWKSVCWSQLDAGDIVRFHPINDQDINCKLEEHFRVTEMPLIRVVPKHGHNYGPSLDAYEWSDAFICADCGKTLVYNAEDGMSAKQVSILDKTECKKVNHAPT